MELSIFNPDVDGYYIFRPGEDPARRLYVAQEKELSLSQCYKSIKTDVIEIAPNLRKWPNAQIIVDEEGRLKPSPWNRSASELCGQDLFGTVIIACGKARLS